VKSKKLIGLILTAAVLLSGCNTGKPADETAPSSSDTSETTKIVLTETEETADVSAEVQKYKFNPYIKSKKLGDIIPEENYEALHNLIDALCEGKDTFACASEEAYKWATNDGTLNNFYPAACMKVSGEGNDGTKPFENGVGRVYLNMPSDEFIQREKQFEADIEEILNTWLEYDDNDFEKAIKLYDYMESTFTYGDISPAETHDGSDYKAFQLKKGVCEHMASIYAYLLMQVGVEAMNIGIFEPDMCHAWTYAIIDGKAYHIDATWALKNGFSTSDLCLDYFMMSDARREGTGCLLNDITVQILPNFWANKYEGLEFKATDTKYDVLSYCTFKGLDEVNKILYYTDAYGNPQELSYA
jgi:transglutaminase-like putative cysteine protease